MKMNETLKKFKEKITLDPLMALLILIVIVIILSGVLSWVGFESSYNVLNETSGEYTEIPVTVTSLLNLSGLKYVFSNTLSNFVSFTPLSSLIIVLIGIGLMESSGFLKTAFTLLTKYTKKNIMTFIVAFIGVTASIAGDIGYVIIIPLAALLYKYGKRNPKLGIITAFAGLTCGSGLSILFTSIDSSMQSTSLLASHVLDVSYTIPSLPTIFIMLVATILISLTITYITEKKIALKMEKYILDEDEKVKEITKKDLKGLVIALAAGLLYLLIFIYNIIPGLPLSGALLDNSQNLYIDKLFSYESFFSQGFVFIVTMLFIVLGLFYGIGSKKIKNNNDFCHCLGHSLDKVGKTLILIFISSILISVFKKTNIGAVIVAGFSNLIDGTSFTGIPLIVLLFIIGALSAIFIPSALIKWSMLGSVSIPVAMNAGFTPIFTQTIFRFSECFTLGITPLFAYFIIYLAFLDSYNQDKKPINLFKSIGYMTNYSLITGLILLALLVAWYLVGLPIGIGSFAVI